MHMQPNTQGPAFSNNHEIHIELVPGIETDPRLAQVLSGPNSSRIGEENSSLLRLTPGGQTRCGCMRTIPPQTAEAAPGAPAPRMPTGPQDEARCNALPVVATGSKAGAGPLIAKPKPAAP